MSCRQKINKKGEEKKKKEKEKLTWVPASGHNAVNSDDENRKTPVPDTNKRRN